MQFRPATIGDAEGIARAHVDGWQWGYRDLMPGDYLASLKWEDRVDRWRTSVDEFECYVVVALDDSNTVRGFVSSGPARDDDLKQRNIHEIYSLYVDRDAAGGGIGAALLERGVSSADPNAENVTVWVLSTNARARDFYGRHGFVEDGITKAYDRDGIHLKEIRMIRAQESSGGVGGSSSSR